ncbi:MAG: TPM domain-containing protein [Opitutus sp.]
MVSAMRMLGVALVLLLARAWAAEVIPPAPRDHFNDYAGMVAPDFARQLNDELTQFERETSNQVVVALYPKMQSNSSIEDYAVRVAQAWGVGQKDRKNGAVMFVFKDDRAIFIQVGYGLEGVLPDVRCKQIIENEITPRFRAGDFQGGVGAGVRAIMASIRGEYQGTGATVKDATNRGRSGGIPGGFILLIFLAIIIRSIFGNRRNSVYSRNGRRGIWMLPGSGGGWGGGGWSSGGGSSGGGGSFSGGGGSFGGGGAGGRW